MSHWHKLILLSEGELKMVDIAEMNFACAEGLRGTERFSSSLCLRMIAKLTELVADETNRRMPLFYANPSEFEGTEGRCRMMAMNTIFTKA